MSDAAPSVLDRLRSLLASRYIDDGIDRTPTAVNLVADGSFEYDANGAIPADWAKDFGPADMLAQTGSVPSGGAGAKSAAIGASSSGTWQYRQLTPMDVGEGVSYTAIARFLQNGSASQGPLMVIQWERDDASVVSQTVSTAQLVGLVNGASRAMSVVGIAPAGATKARLLLTKVDNTNVWWGSWDAIRFAPTAQIGTYADGDTTGWYWTGTPGNSVSATPRFPPSSDQILEAILGGIADGAERLGVVAFGDDNVPVGRALSDPSVAPDWALPHASLYTSGGLLPGQKAGETDAAFLARARDAAVYPLGIKAGTNEAIVRTVQPLLTGTKSVFTTIGSDPYIVVVRTLPSETPDQAAVAAAITGSYVSGGLRGALRAELALDYAVSTSPQFSEATRVFSAVAAGVTATNVTRGDVT